MIRLGAALALHISDSTGSAGAKHTSNNTLNMSDREFGGNDDLSLPKGTRIPVENGSSRAHPTDCRAATVQKIVTEILQSEPGMTFAKDSRDLLIECCVEFITLISSEANEIAEKDAKKTIAAEHVQKALEELDFHDYVPAILEVEKDFKNQQKVRACMHS